MITKYISNALKLKIPWILISRYCNFAKDRQNMYAVDKFNETIMMENQWYYMAGLNILVVLHGLVIYNNINDADAILSSRYVEKQVKQRNTRMQSTLKQRSLCRIKWSVT